MNRVFYTYAYLRKDGTPYYVGKGKGNRAFGKHGRNVVMPPRDRIIFLKRDLSEEEAFRHEVYMIHVLGRKDSGTGILRNTSSGGEGSSGCTWITNGCEETYISSGAPIPPGWVKGRKTVKEETKKKLKERKNLFWITNGFCERRIPASGEIPEGWKRGRLPFSEEAIENFKKAPKKTGWKHSDSVKQKLRKAALNRKVRYMWMSNGTKEKWVPLNTDIPEGWRRGRKARPSG